MIRTDGRPTVSSPAQRELPEDWPVAAKGGPEITDGAVELDSRRLDGGAGYVTLLYGKGCHIVVEDASGQQVAVVPVKDAEAREVFLHPFADKRVPDIFKTTPEAA